jgi:hypothetical protein
MAPIRNNHRQVIQQNENRDMRSAMRNSNHQACMDAEEVADRADRDANRSPDYRRWVSRLLRHSQTYRINRAAYEVGVERLTEAYANAEERHRVADSNMTNFSTSSMTSGLLFSAVKAGTLKYVPGNAQHPVPLIKCAPGFLTLPGIPEVIRNPHAVHMIRRLLRDNTAVAENQHLMNASFRKICFVNLQWRHYLRGRKAASQTMVRLLPEYAYNIMVSFL